MQKYWLNSCIYKIHRVHSYAGFIMSEQKNNDQIPSTDIDITSNIPDVADTNLQLNAEISLDDFFTESQEAKAHTADNAGIDGAFLAQLDSTQTYTNNPDQPIDLDFNTISSDAIVLDKAVDATENKSHTPDLDQTPSIQPQDTSNIDTPVAASWLANQHHSTSKKQKTKQKDGFFSKKSKTSFSQTPTNLQKKTHSGSLLNDSKKLNMFILIGVLIVAISAALIYINFSNTPDSTVVAPTVAPTPVSDTAAKPDAATSAEIATSAPLPNDILPDTGKPSINPDEILNAQIPDDPALVKEEIDRLSDTSKQLDEQGKLIQEQLSMMEDLTTAKAEQIALLEAQIAELEKQKTINAAPKTSQPQTQ